MTSAAIFDRLEVTVALPTVTPVTDRICVVKVGTSRLPILVITTTDRPISSIFKDVE
jgi:hypothetical protein